MKKITSVPPPFSTRTKGPSYTIDCDSGVKEYVEAYARTAPADDLLLDFLVDDFERAMRNPLYKLEHAEALFWEAVKDFGRSDSPGYNLTKAEMEILHKARQGDLKSVQTLVKANSRMIRLPFVQDAMRALLREQKYSVNSTLALKDAWANFLHKRPCGKILHPPGGLEMLVNIAKRAGEKTVDAPCAVAEHLGISERSLKGIIAVKGRKRGGPKRK